VYLKDWVIVAAREHSSNCFSSKICHQIPAGAEYCRGLQKLADGMQSRPLVDLPLADGESCAVSKQVTKIPIVPV